MNKPLHPGPFLRDEVVDANGLTVGEMADLLGVARPTISKLLNGRADLSAQMAFRIEKVFGLEMRRC